MKQALSALLSLRQDPSKWDKVRDKNSIQRVLKHERLAALLDGEQGQKDVVSTLKDEEFRASLREIDWGNIAKIANDAAAETSSD